MADKNLEISVLLDFYGGMLTTKQEEALYLYYNEDLSLAEISEHQNISRQGVRDSIKRGEAALLEMEEKLGFRKRFTSNVDAIAEIKTLANEVAALSDRYGGHEQIDKRIARIIQLVDQMGE